MLQADFRKDVERLLTNWTYVPIEVDPKGEKRVIERLKALGSPNPETRTLTAEKEGPLRTDQDNFIVKAPFLPLLTSKDSEDDSERSSQKDSKGRTWKAEKLAAAVKSITGVLEVGLFVGQNGPEAIRSGTSDGGQKPVAVYFGMQDGSVKVRYAEGYARAQ